MCNKCLRLSSLNCRVCRGGRCETKQWTMQFYTPSRHHLETEHHHLPPVIISEALSERARTDSRPLHSGKLGGHKVHSFHSTVVNSGGHKVHSLHSTVVNSTLKQCHLLHIFGPLYCQIKGMNAISDLQPLHFPVCTPLNCSHYITHCALTQIILTSTGE